MKKTLFCLLVFLVSLSLFARGGKETVTVEEKINVITMAIPVDPDGLDPMLTAAASTFQITSNIYETLITVDEKGNLEPCLADSWSISEDGLSISFNLRENAAFSNGKKCGSEEVKEIASDRDSNFIYRVGEIVRVDNFDENRWNECSTGIHFFITRREAEQYEA